MEDMTQKIDAFKALGDPTRFRIIKLLSESGRQCVTALANRLEIAQPTISQHLKILKVANLVAAERIGTHIHYHLQTSTLKALSQQIDSFSALPVLNEHPGEGCTSKDCRPPEKLSDTLPDP